MPKLCSLPAVIGCSGPRDAFEIARERAASASASGSKVTAFTSVYSSSRQKRRALAKSSSDDATCGGTTQGSCAQYKRFSRVSSLTCLQKQHKQSIKKQEHEQGTRLQMLTVLYEYYCKAWRKHTPQKNSSQQKIHEQELRTTLCWLPHKLTSKSRRCCFNCNLAKLCELFCLGCHDTYKEGTKKVHLGVVGPNEFLENVQRLAVQWNRVGHVEGARKTRSQVLGVVLRHLGQAASVRRDLYGVRATYAHGQLCPTRSPEAVWPNKIREDKHKAVEEQA